MAGLTPNAVRKCVRTTMSAVSQIAFLSPEDARVDPEAEIAGALTDLTGLRQLIARREYDPEVRHTARELVSVAGMNVPPGGRNGIAGMLSATGRLRG